MEHNQNLLNDIQETIKKIHELHDLAYTQYSQAVDEVLAGRITEDSQIEHILDGILDFGDDLRFLELSKKLCRHIYYQYPQLVGNFVSMYRALFVEGGNDDGADNNHDQSSQRCL